MAKDRARVDRLCALSSHFKGGPWQATLFKEEVTIGLNKKEMRVLVTAQVGTAAGRCSGLPKACRLLVGGRARGTCAEGRTQSVCAMRAALLP